MVQLSASSVASPKSPKMGKAKTPKKSNAVATPVKTEVTTAKPAKNTPAKAALQTPKVKKESLKEAKSTPKAALQAPKNGTASAKKAKKVKTPKQKPDEDVEMASESEEEAAPAASPVKAQPPPKKSTKKETVESEEAEIAIKPKSTKSAAPEQIDNSMKVGKYSLFVKGLNYNTKEVLATQHFSQFGKVTKCVIPPNPDKKGLNKGFCFVEFDSQKAMDKAMAASHKLGRRTLIVTKNDADVAAGKRKRDESTQRGGDEKRQAATSDNELFVAKLSLSTTKDTLQKHFSQFGEVISVGLPMKSDESENKGFAFILFKEASSLQKAIANSDQVVDSSKVVVEPRKKVVVKKASPKHSRPNEMFVGGLNHATPKHILLEHFSKFGKISQVTLPMNKQAKTNKGFGFISFKSAKGLAAALEEKHEIDGKQVGVKPAGAKSEENGAASKKVDAKKVKAAPAAEKMEEDDDDVEADSEDEEVEGEDDDAEDEESDAEEDE